MSDFLYTRGFFELVWGSLYWGIDSWRVSLVNTFLYSPDPDHLSLADIPAGAILATGDLVNPVIIGGAYTSDDVTLTGAASTVMGHALVLYRFAPLLADCTLLSFHDSTPGLPCAPDGLPLTLIWPHSAALIFNDVGEFGLWSAVIHSLAADIAGSCSNPAGIGRYIGY